MTETTAPEETRSWAKELLQTRDDNFEVISRLRTVLENHADIITPEDLRELGNGEAHVNEAVFASLLTSFCGIDPEGARGRRLFEHWFRPGVKQLDPTAWDHDPYIRDIRIPETAFDSWQLTSLEYSPCEAFLRDDLITDSALREIPRVGFFPRTFRYPAILQDGHEWVSVKPSEIETMRPAVATVSGRVITFGLGFGYFTYCASLRNEVQTVTVVERDPRAVALFEAHILPQFRHPEKVEIILDDAVHFATERLPTSDYDWVFADTWHDASDGLGPYLALRQLEAQCPGTRFLYWAENSLLALLREQNFNRLLAASENRKEALARLSDAGLKRMAADTNNPLREPEGGSLNHAGARIRSNNRR